MTRRPDGGGRLERAAPQRSSRGAEPASDAPVDAPIDVAMDATIDRMIDMDLDADLSKGYLVADLAAVPPVSCPCGQARRAFAVPGNDVATLHVTEITRDARLHYHERMTELYFILEGEGRLELHRAGEPLREVPLRPGVAVLIRSLTRHRAVADSERLRVLIVPVPAFDTSDEHFDATPPSPAAGGPPR